MASSDDEGESIPQTVLNYHFVDEKDEPVSFSELPIQWNNGENPEREKKQIFMHGTIDNGLQKMYKQVMSWKFDLLNEQPEISVLSKENNWIKLQKPRKSFEDTIRTILITVQSLHFLRSNPESSGKILWDHLSKVFSLYEPRPYENDLVNHMTLISEAVKRDEALAKSKFLITFLEEKPGKRSSIDEDVGTTALSGFIVDDLIDEIKEDGSDEEYELFDSVCSICDNGGELLCCEGRCLRSFHATVEAGEDSMCDSLGLSDTQVDEIQNFLCKNCQYKQHQCFVCGELGSSDKSSGAEVFPCVSATCGRFYHPLCVANLLHRQNEANAEELKKKIASGEPFTCPIHKCCVCDQGENKMDPALQFAVCRRCPRSYHRKCLPSKIAFEDNDDEGILQRAWEDLIPNRILIYCLKHEIDDELATPVRNHIKFPNIGEKKKRKEPEFLASREKVLPKMKSPSFENFVEKRTVAQPMKRVEKLAYALKRVDSSTKREGRTSGKDSLKKQRVSDPPRNLNRSSSVKGTKSTNSGGKITLGDRLYALYSKGSESVISSEDASDSEQKLSHTVRRAAKEISNSLPLDDDSKRRILALLNDEPSVTLEEIIEKHKVPTMNAYMSKNGLDKTITLGKVEGSIEAIHAALHELEEGCSIEDAKAVCEPGLLNQMVRWKNKLKVYLAPLIYGMRYTSFGRHFTKANKLKEIVDVLHWYVEEGDMIVDMCCGVNDFSCLMKKKLDEMGKTCLYKNYDLMQAKNDFNFEKRDWMSVRPQELPPGSELIMGLNPPFGVKASLANAFINKALAFKPKLLILIVPQETERLDKKKFPYDLIWEDNQLLAGKSFYLPGSVDVNDKQMDDWNVNAPPLYLWSHPDWTAKHRLIAQRHSHLSRVCENIHLEENLCEGLACDLPMVDGDHNGQTSILAIDRLALDKLEKVQEGNVSEAGIHNDSHFSDSLNNQSNENLEKWSRGKTEAGKCLEEKLEEYKHDDKASITCNSLFNNAASLPLDGHSSVSAKIPSCEDVGKESYGDVENHDNYDHGKNQSNENLDNWSHGKAEVGTCCDEKLAGCKQNDKHSFPHHSQRNISASRLLDGHSSVSAETSSFKNFVNESYHFDHMNVSGSDLQFPTGYGGSWEDNMAKMYSLNHEEPFSTLNNVWSNSSTSGPVYGFRSPVEQIRGYPTGSMDSYGYKSSYIDEFDQNYKRESDLRSQIRHYGQQGSDSFGQSSGYLAGHSPGFSSSYGQLGSVSDLSYNGINTSTMQRYAPRLDELNHTRMNINSGSEASSMNISGIYDPRGSQNRFRAGSMDFSPAAYHSFSQQNSSGWHNN